MSHRVNRKDLDGIERLQKERFGFVRWSVCHRYGYYAIDELSPEGGTLRTVEAGLSARETRNMLRAFMQGFSFAATHQSLQTQAAKTA